MVGEPWTDVCTPTSAGLTARDAPPVSHMTFPPVQKGDDDGAALGALRGHIGLGPEGGPQGGSCELRVCRGVVGPIGRLQGQQSSRGQGALASQGALPKVAGIPTVGPTWRLHLCLQQTDSRPAETLLPRGSGHCFASSQQQGCPLVLEPRFPCLWDGATIKEQQTHRHTVRDCLRLPGWNRGRREKDWEYGISRGHLLYYIQDG